MTRLQVEGCPVIRDRRVRPAQDSPHVAPPGIGIGPRRHKLDAVRELRRGAIVLALATGLLGCSKMLVRRPRGDGRGSAECSRCEGPLLHHDS